MIGLLYIIAFIGSGVSIFVFFKYLINADNRWNYFHKTFGQQVTFLKIITDFISFFTYKLSSAAELQISFILYPGLLNKKCKRNDI